MSAVRVSLSARGVVPEGVAVADAGGSIPPFDGNGNLPPGVYRARLEDLSRFASNPHRRKLLRRAVTGIENLRAAGVRRIWVGGSFVTEKERPGDIDGCWEDGPWVDKGKLDEAFLDRRDPREAARRKYGLDFQVAGTWLMEVHRPIEAFLRTDADGNRKGSSWSSLERSRMIQNKRQYSVTKGQIARLESALDAAREAKDRVDGRVHKAMTAALKSQIDELRERLHRFEELERAKELHLDSVEELPELLIRARVARGYTQRDLAERLKLKPQQIQRYEATRYRSVSLRRLQQVMKALGVDLQADVSLEAN
jgi:ribosome-binding protein aMBF1 (putative translation factor)